MPVRRHPVATSLSQTPIRGLPLDLALVHRLRATYMRVRIRDVDLAWVFYAKLFAAAPELRAMFRGDPSSQAAKLTAALDMVVTNLENPAENGSMLGDLGRRHAGYGATREHYDLVVHLLVESMREVLGLAAEDREILEWRTALRLIADQMIAAAGGSGPSGTPG